MAVFFALLVAESPASGEVPRLDVASQVEPCSATSGPLRIHSVNPRYFGDRNGNAIYLTGSHHHENLQNRVDKPNPRFDYPAYLNFLQEYRHNFMRLWAWEDARFAPLPYLRTGPGLALDGQPKFDLGQFDQDYFDRLRSRVIAARDRGVYVSVMLFQGWSIDRKREASGLDALQDPWRYHPFNGENNINGIDGDVDKDGDGLETHTLSLPNTRRLQESYVRKVLDALNDLDNVLWEISNESRKGSEDWQHHMISFIRQYEATKPQQHPLGMTAEWPGGENAKLLVSPADWISPQDTDADPYQDNPPAADGRKVILTDTDHLWGAGGNHEWVWKSFMRGLQPIFMDLAPPWDTRSIPDATPIREAMGYTRAYSCRIDLAKIEPRSDLCSSTYCLANPGTEYLIYAPSRIDPSASSENHPLGSTQWVDLSDAPGDFCMEWFDPSIGNAIPAGIIKGGSRQNLDVPFTGEAVLYLAAKEPTGQCHR